MTRINVVTGAASGIGLATANVLRSRGETVIGLDLAGTDINADLSTPSGRLQASVMINRLCTGRIDSIIACAGVAMASGEDIIAVNYFGVVDLLPKLLPLLKASDAPRAVVISSLASIHPSDPALVQACLNGDEQDAKLLAHDNPQAYASSKQALSRWIRRTAVLSQWAGSRILLNGIAPGTVRTPMTATLLSNDEGRSLLEQVTPCAVPDYADPQDIAPLLTFLASAENRYMVGQIPFIDGGSDILLRGDDI